MLRKSNTRGICHKGGRRLHSGGGVVRSQGSLMILGGGKKASKIGNTLCIFVNKLEKTCLTINDAEIYNKRAI